MGDWSHHHGEVNDGAHPACDIGDWGHLHGESNEGPDKHINIGNEASGRHRNGRGARPHFRRSGSSRQGGTRSGRQPSDDQTLREDHGLHDIGEGGSRRSIEDQTVEFEHEATS